MMRIDIISVVPELLDGPLNHSIVQRARKKQLVDIHVHDLRTYGLGKHRQVDDYMYGGGAGMVLKPEPVFQVVEELTSQRTYDEVLFMTPDAPVLQQMQVNALSLKQNLILLCGHYKGVDERIRQQLITREVSIGDYVLSGGELAAAVLTDAIVRILPGVLGDETSALSDSFQDGLLSAPVYTRPKNFRGMEVPDVLRSGHAAKIEQWRHDQALVKTQKIRPDLYRRYSEKK